MTPLVFCRSPFFLHSPTITFCVLTRAQPSLRCAFNDIVRLKCVEVKLIRPLLHVCQGHRHQACVSAAASAIKMIALNGHARLKTSDLGGLPLLSALCRHTCDAVALESVLAIRNLALSHVNRGYLCDCGGTRALAHVLLKHSNDSVVCTCLPIRHCCLSAGV